MVFWVFLLASVAAISLTPDLFDSEENDWDNDGWSDVDEDSCNTNPFYNLSTPLDNDYDGICNYLDDDDDGDGYGDSWEKSCLSDPLSAYSLPKDDDYDGICNHIDVDDDGDGWRGRRHAG